MQAIQELSSSHAQALERARVEFEAYLRSTVESINSTHQLAVAEIRTTYEGRIGSGQLQMDGMRRVHAEVRELSLETTPSC
jgi:hypothetical protein